ncbi:GNAT family N-acetyltransferase [Thiospirochaeta perfilievii]|uniref:GNAT family N-acetyltransferase n=1 Tax=Thiospirochaeta perfilievii TaxID=252967 RepID=A0A5C1Q7W0_9SPIO|nr:GNAT family N-acetyltransferase [Thiospirochaeta perfilievii]QEN03541.1 GNAT family N-acetyltransferase [Thiospirochaeta perfilievii]
MGIKKLKSNEIPYNLVYLADEDADQIKKYIDSTTFFGSFCNGSIVGIIGLNETIHKSVEIVCVAVEIEYQDRKIGSELLEYAIQYSKENSYKEILIKTGNSSIKQIYLYQSCGFIIDSINKNYFIKNYKTIIYENGLKCRDQIVFKYKIYNQEELSRKIDEYWKRFISINKEYKDREYEVWNFCYGEILPNRLLGLVKTGIKTATSSAYDLYSKDDKVPQVGDLSIITYGNGLPGCIIETKEIKIIKFNEISENEAKLEGEGNKTLKYWREGHKKFFKIDYENDEKEFSEEIPVLFERFHVIYDEERGY